MVNLPEAFEQRMRERLGSAFPAFLRSYEAPPAKGLRVNTLKISPREFSRRAPFPLEPVPWEESGFYHTAEKAGGDVYHFAGLYYLQEPSAMCAAPLVAAKAGERVLDLCAAPGGKTAQLAAAMGGEGVLVSNDVDFPRAKILSQNVERLGVRNCAVTNAPPDRLAERFPAFFDKILADAPCSGEGMFKKEPNAIPEWSEEGVARCARRQREILESAARLLAEGGTLVYSTCTFAEEEDEWQIEEFLKRHSEFSLEAQRKLYPHEVRGEGHFAAVLRKHFSPSGEVAARGRPFPVRRDGAAERAFSEFAADFFEAPVEGTVTTLSDGRMYLLPSGAPDFGNLRLLRLGVELGEWDGKRFTPAHALAMALGGGARRKISLTREEAERYLRGEQLEADCANGWAAVCAEEFPLGLGKCVGGQVKNHLPKALRMRK